MRLKSIMVTVSSLLLALCIGCNTNKANTPDVKDQVSKALDNAGMKDIKVDVIRTSNWLLWVAMSKPRKTKKKPKTWPKALPMVL